MGKRKKRITRLNVLDYLRLHKKPVTCNDLAAVFGFTRSSAYCILMRLVDDEYLETFEIDPEWRGRPSLGFKLV